jgi:uncharacterized protein YuzE
MIPIDSKSYPYLAVAQATGRPHEYFLNTYTLEEIYEEQRNIKALGRSLGIDYDKIRNVYGVEIWNAAIEKAASEVRMTVTGNWVLPLLEQIRKLKI